MTIVKFSVDRKNGSDLRFSLISICEQATLFRQRVLRSASLRRYSWNTIVQEEGALEVFDKEATATRKRLVIDNIQKCGVNGGRASCNGMYVESENMADQKKTRN